MIVIKSSSWFSLVARTVPHSKIKSEAEAFVAAVYGIYMQTANEKAGHFVPGFAVYFAFSFFGFFFSFLRSIPFAMVRALSVDNAHILSCGRKTQYSRKQDCIKNLTAAHFPKQEQCAAVFGCDETLALFKFCGGRLRIAAPYTVFAASA